MKKIVLALVLASSTLGFSQNYPNNGWGDGGYNNSGYFGDQQDSFYFPDDYYYEYPEDYYPEDYYRGFYNDYRRSISMVNWQRFFMEYNLSRWQINMIIDLNRQFDSYFVWNSYYRMNPNRWYYDRFYALQQIVGPQVFVVFQNNYYQGYSPVVYYTNRCHNFYARRYYVAPRYRNVNVNIYRVDKHHYHKNVGNHYGWNQPRNPHNPGGFREDRGDRTGGSFGGSHSSGVRSQNGGFRGSSENSGIRNQSPREDRGGFRTGRESSEVRNTPSRSENRTINAGNSSDRGERANRSGGFGANSEGRARAASSERSERAGSAPRGGGFR